MSEHKARRLSGKLTIALLMAIVLCVGWTGWQVHNILAAKESAQHTAHQATNTTQKLADQIQQACKQGDVKINGRDLCAKAKKVAKNPTTTIAGPQGDKGDRGETGAAGPAPTQSQILQAVKSYCHDEGCKGEPGRDGDSPTAAQIEAAVSKYCDSNGQCQGPEGDQGKQGKKGEQGEAGKDSTVPGPRGPGPSDSQVQAAVASYCSSHSCAGPKGETGPQGPAGKDGEDGVSISKVECDSSGSWVVTLSDGSVQHPAGTCRVTSTPEPTSTP